MGCAYGANYEKIMPSGWPLNSGAVITAGLQYNFVVIVAKMVDAQLQSKQALGLRGSYCLETTAPHRFIQPIGKESEPRYTREKSALYRFKYFVPKPRAPRFRSDMMCPLSIAFKQKS
jgi:hypothetical protein